MPTVKDIMTKEVLTIESSKSVFEAAELMSTKGVGCVIVVIKAFPVGIITERDIVRRIVAKRASPDVKVTEIMTKTLITIDQITLTRLIIKISLVLVYLLNSILNR